ncbi:hypothetical protein A2U01_0080939, partial [Trifolium medium]|nr:hypothetical protein [Trifolium medium]
FPPRNLWTCEIRGGVFAEDNVDVLERREASLAGLEETDASSAVATCVG